MTVAAATKTTTPTPGASSGAPSGTLSGDSFMTLLVAQLKAQDPTAPMDPTQFVAQLVQFNSLQQLINIRQDLDGAVKPAATTGTNPTGLP